MITTGAVTVKNAYGSTVFPTAGTPAIEFCVITGTNGVLPAGISGNAATDANVGETAVWGRINAL